MGDPIGLIRHNYHAVHHGGKRPMSAVCYIVLHSGETTNPDTAAEGMGSWFENLASGGSTHFGVDNNSTQQYLDITTIAYGAPPLNDHGVHIEAAGRAALTSKQWFAQYRPMLERLAWLLADLHKRTGVPLILLAGPASLKHQGAAPGHKVGVVTHAMVTAAFGVSTHTDPGPGFPTEWVVNRAKQYLKNPLTKKEKARIKHRLANANRASLRWVKRLVGRLLRKG